MYRASPVNINKKANTIPDINMHLRLAMIKRYEALHYAIRNYVRVSSALGSKVISYQQYDDTLIRGNQYNFPGGSEFLARLYDKRECETHARERKGEGEKFCQNAYT